MLQYCRHRSRWGEVVFADGGTPSWSTIQDTVRYCSQIIRIFQVKWYWRILMSFDIYVMSVQCENLSMSCSPGWTWVKFVEIWYSSVVMVQTLVQSSIWPSVLHCSNRSRFEGPNWIPQDPTGSNVTMVLAPKLIRTDGICDIRLGTHAKMNMK